MPDSQAQPVHKPLEIVSQLAKRFWPSRGSIQLKLSRSLLHQWLDDLQWVSRRPFEAAGLNVRSIKTFIWSRRPLFGTPG